MPIKNIFIVMSKEGLLQCSKRYLTWNYRMNTPVQCQREELHVLGHRRQRKPINLSMAVRMSASSHYKVLMYKLLSDLWRNSVTASDKYFYFCLFVCVEVLRPSQPNGSC